MADVLKDFVDELAYVPPPIDASGQVIPDEEIKAKLNPPAPDPEPIEVPGNTQSSEDRGGVGSNFVTRSAQYLGYAEGQARKAYDWAASRPTPGGTAAVLTAIFIILFAAVPVSGQGKTRLELVWATLTGRTFLQGRVSPMTGLMQASAPGGYSDTPAVEVVFRGSASDVDLSEL